LVITALTRGITLRITGSEDYSLARRNTLTEVRGFLGICGIIRIWVKDFVRCTKPLIILTKKDTDFVWGLDQKASLEDLKQAIITAPAFSQLTIIWTKVSFCQ